MEKEPDSSGPPVEPPPGGGSEPPPFDPDPRLIGELERAPKRETGERPSLPSEHEK